MKHPVLNALVATLLLQFALGSPAFAQAEFVLGGVAATYVVLSRQGEADAARRRAEATEAERQRRAASAARPAARPGRPRPR